MDIHSHLLILYLLLLFAPIFIINLFLVMVFQGFEENIFENKGILSQEYLEKFVTLLKKYEPKNIKVVKHYEFFILF